MQDERQLNLADQNFRDIRPVMGAEIDMAIGSDENDYEIKIRRDQWDDRYKYGNVFYINDTEFGGIIGSGLGTHQLRGGLTRRTGSIGPSGSLPPRDHEGDGLGRSGDPLRRPLGWLPLGRRLRFADPAEIR